MYTICPEDFDLIKTIRNKKLFKCIFKEDTLVLFDEKSIISDNYYNSSIIKLTKSKIAGCTGGLIKVWNLSTGDCLEISKIGTRMISIAKISDSILVSVSFRNLIILWNYHTGKCLKTIIEDNTKHRNSVIKLTKTRIAISSENIKIWDIKSGECIKTFETIDPDISYKNEIRKVIKVSKTQILSFREKILKRWDTQTGECLKAIDFNSNHKITSLIKLCNSKVIIVHDYIQVFDYLTGEILKTYDANVNSFYSLWYFRTFLVKINSTKVLISNDISSWIWDLKASDKDKEKTYSSIRTLEQPTCLSKFQIVSIYSELESIQIWDLYS